MESEQNGGDLWEPNLKHCHDGSWKCVKVGGSVIFKDEPIGEEEAKRGSDMAKERRGGGGCGVISVVSFPLLLCVSSQAPLQREQGVAAATGSVLRGGTSRRLEDSAAHTEIE